MDLNSESDSDSEQRTPAHSTTPEPPGGFTLGEGCALAVRSLGEGSALGPSPPAGVSAMRTPAYLTTKLPVGTRLLVQWENGWESGAVGDLITPVMGGIAKDGVTPATLHRVDYDDGESHLHDLTTLRIKLETTLPMHGASAASSSSACDACAGKHRRHTCFEDAILGDDTWAQCEQCDKWRRVVVSSGMELPSQWSCELNPDKAFASCQIAEEQWSDGEDQEEPSGLDALAAVASEAKEQQNRSKGEEEEKPRRSRNPDPVGLHARIPNPVPHSLETFLTCPAPPHR